jgi:hypothetical protein
MAPKKFKPAQPNGSPPKTEANYVRVPTDLWREMCIATARYAFVREQTLAKDPINGPSRFDAACDEGIARIDAEARAAAEHAKGFPVLQ